MPAGARSTLRARFGAAALALAGVLFVLYPALRSFSDETSLQGAAAFASGRWLAAHMLAMVAFTLLGLGLLSLHTALQATSVGSIAFWALIAGWLGIGLTLPFYGGEAFGLQAIGQEALNEQRADLVGLAETVRSGPGLVMFLTGLLLLAISTVMAATAIWQSDTLAKWSGIPLAVAFVLYIPQFFATQPLRVAHGLLVALGCIWVAAGIWARPAA